MPYLTLFVELLLEAVGAFLLPFGFLQVLVNGIVLTYADDETVRDILLFLTSGALLVAMTYAIYLATRQPSREERVGSMIAARSAQ